MKYRGFKKENFAVAGVIEALLLIALVAVILSTIQLYYVPEIMQQKESDHMDVVANQFSHLKSVIDSQSLIGVLNSSLDIVYAPMSSPITLGSSELPYFVSARSSGQVNIVDLYSAGDSNITVDNEEFEDIGDGIPLTSVKYRAYNSYFPAGASWQEYILEGGGIFLQQYDGGTVLVQPSITAEDTKNGSGLDVNINFFIPLFKSIQGKNVTGGFKDCFIRTNYSNHYAYNFSDIAYLNITTEYLEPWVQSLINDDSGILWDYNDININVTYDNPSDPQYITITPLADNHINLHFTIVEIGVQTGPGIVYTYN